MAHPRGRKRQRADEGLGDLLGRFEASVQSAPAGAGALLEAWGQLQQLQAAVERRLVTCSIDSLTPHDAVEFIYRRRVRLVRVARNDFEDDVSSEDEQERSEAATGAAADDASATGRNNRPLAPAPSGAADQRRLVVHFQVGKERLVATCTAQGPPGDAARYSLELRLWPTGAPRAEKAIMRCFSWDQDASEVDAAAWEAFKGRCGRFIADRRPAVDFARGVVLLGLFSELQRKFAKSSSEAEDEVPGLVSTLSVCRMMAAAVLPTTEGRLLNRATGGAPPAAAAAAAGEAASAEGASSAGDEGGLAAGSGAQAAGRGGGSGAATSGNA